MFSTPFSIGHEFQFANALFILKILVSCFWGFSTLVDQRASQFGRIFILPASEHIEHRTSATLASRDVFLRRISCGILRSANINQMARVYYFPNSSTKYGDCASTPLSVESHLGVGIHLKLFWKVNITNLETYQLSSDRVATLVLEAGISVRSRLCRTRVLLYTVFTASQPLPNHVPSVFAVLFWSRVLRTPWSMPRLTFLFFVDCDRCESPTRPFTMRFFRTSTLPRFVRWPRCPSSRPRRNYPPWRQPSPVSMREV